MKTSFVQHVVFCLMVSSVHLLFEITRVNAKQTDEAKSMANEQNEIRVPINLQSLSLDEKKKFKDSFDIIFTDCDGVLIDPTGAISNAPETVKELIKEKKDIRYITNSNMRTKAQIIDRLTSFGFVGVTEDSLISPLGLLGDYVREKLPLGKSVYVVGREVVCEELRGQNIHCFGPGKDEMNDQMTQDISKVDLELPENVGAVIIGFDVHINYLKILKAFRFLRNEDCLYILLAPDETFPTKSGDRFPSGGAIAASITVASGRAPYVLGKPGPHIIEALKKMAGDPQRALFVGDKLNTDIITGHKCSFRTLLVLTGMDRLDAVEKYIGSKDPEEQMYVPDYYTNAFSDLVFK